MDRQTGRPFKLIGLVVVANGKIHEMNKAYFKNIYSQRCLNSILETQVAVAMREGERDTEHMTGRGRAY